jgi:hypothetical protein
MGQLVRPLPSGGAAADGGGGGAEPVALGGLYKLNAVDPWLESAWFHQPFLNLKCDILVSQSSLSHSNFVSLRRGGAVHFESS